MLYCLKAPPASVDGNAIQNITNDINQNIYIPYTSKPIPKKENAIFAT